MPSCTSPSEPISSWTPWKNRKPPQRPRGRSRLRLDRKKSITHHRHHQGPLPWPDIAFQQDNLLPGTQDQLTLGDRHGQARTLQGGLQVGMAVAIVPGLLVAILPAGGNQSVEHLRHIAAQARLELDSAD